LTELYARRQRGEAIDPVEISKAADAAVRWVVPKEAAVGVDVGNDGEQTRDGFFIYVRQRMTGFGGGWVRPARADVERHPIFAEIRRREFAGRTAVNARDYMPEAVGEVVYTGEEAIRADCAGFAKVLAECGHPFVETFMTAPSPGMVASAIRNRHYDSDERYLEALGRALSVEYRIVVESGFVLQLDCPDLALERHVTYKDRPLADFQRFVERVVATINRAIEGISRDRVRIHVCWGNYEGPHDADVPLDDILPIIMEANVGGFVLPFANGRHAHDYHSLARHPLADDQVIVAGVIDTVTNVVEHPEVIAERLERVAAVVGDPTRVLAGTDCGFATAAGMGRVAEDVVWTKLAALRDGARLASKRLFKG
jgi:5-methyltetrahydropteroyltriglutamate--homocysteine methyltransferase